ALGIGAGAVRGPRRHPHSLGLCAARGARASERMDFHKTRQRRISGAERGRDKTLAMTARFEPKSAEHDQASDIMAAIRRAARQGQFLEVVSAEEARARLTPHVDLSPPPAAPVSVSAALGRVLARAR